MEQKTGFRKRERFVRMLAEIGMGVMPHRVEGVLITLVCEMPGCDTDRDISWIRCDDRLESYSDRPGSSARAASTPGRSSIR